MKKQEHKIDRRALLKTLGLGAMGFGVARCVPGTDITSTPILTGHGKTATWKKITTPSQVSLVKGDDARDNTFKSLMNIEDDIMASLEGKKRILVKPNFVKTDNPLCATSVESVRGILDFIRPRWDGPIEIGESTVSDNGTFEGYKAYGYLPLEQEYGVTLSDLNEQPFVERFTHGKDHVPLRVRIISTFLDRDQYIISAAKMKTHNRVLVTLSLKNILLAAPYNEYNTCNDKRNLHTEEERTKDDILHYNMFHLAQEVYPDLGVIDGFESMEGNGPTSGTPLDTRIALASLDPLALDSLGTKIMGFDPTEIIYLSAMNEAGMGQGDLDKIQTIGTDLKECQYNFKPNELMVEPYGLG